MGRRPSERKKKFKGFDWFEDQLTEIERLATKTGMTQADIVRAMADAQLGTPKEKKQ